METASFEQLNANELNIWLQTEANQLPTLHNPTPEILKRWLVFLHALLYANRIVEAARYLGECESIFETALTQTTITDEIRKLYIERLQLVIRFIPRQQTIFGEFPYYQAIEKQLTNLFPDYHPEKLAFYSRFYTDYYLWKQSGGFPSDANNAEYESIETRFRAMGNAAIKANDFRELAIAFVDFLSKTGHLSDAISIQQSLLEYLTKNSSPNSEIADLSFQLATFYFQLHQYHKAIETWKQAQSYYVLVMQTNPDSMESWQIAQQQCEAWIEEAQSKINLGIKPIQTTSIQGWDHWKEWILTHNKN
ncbi:MAG: hypothetical protein NZ108_00840 [Bacteroidia bacterium]|nr:hypothetical protein [Bacteroidia bacterium]